MKRYLRNPQLLIPALIFIVLLTIPLTRRYTALQMGWQRTEAGSILPRSHALKDDPVWNSDWFKLVDKLQHYGEIPNEGDQYLRSHPQEVALLSARICYLISIYQMPHRAGELNPAPLYIPRRDENAAPPTPGSSYEQREAARQKAILPLMRELSLIGQKQEPQNAFYDWILALVAYAQYQDDLGWRYLQDALEKPQFDLHQLDLAHEALRIERQVLGRPLLWEEKYLSASSVRFYSFFRTRSLADWLQWKAIKEMREGKFQQALLIQETMHRLGILMARQAKLQPTASFGTLLLGRAYFTPLELPIRPAIGPPPFRPESTQEERFYKVAQFADAHNLPQLHDIGQDYLRSRRYVQRVQSSAPDLFSGSITSAQFTMMRLSWICGVILISVTGGAALGRLCLFWAKPSVQAPLRLSKFAAVTSWIMLILPVAALLGYAFSGVQWTSSIWVWDLDQVSIGVLLVLFILTISTNLLVALLLPWRRIIDNHAISLWTQTKVLLAAIVLLLTPPVVYFLTMLFPFYYQDIVGFLLDFPCRVYFYYIKGMQNPYAVQIFVPWEYRDLLLHLTTFFIFFLIYSLLLWLIIRHFRAQKMRGYWKNVIYMTRCSFGSFAWWGTGLYALCMILTVTVRMQVDAQPPPIASSESLALHADRRDLTDEVDPHQFYREMEEGRN